MTTPFVLTFILQKIEKLKAQLTALADIIAPRLLGRADDDGDDELEETELDVLRQAGVIQASQKSKRPNRSTKHLIFVDNEEEGKKNLLRRKSLSLIVFQPKTMLRKIMLFRIYLLRQCTKIM